MNGAELKARVEALRWYHTIDLGQGVVTKGVDDSPARLGASSALGLLSTCASSRTTC